MSTSFRSLGAADALLRVVERAQPAGVALDGRLGAAELVDLAHRDDARVVVVVLGDRDREAHDARRPRRAR